MGENILNILGVVEKFAPPEGRGTANNENSSRPAHRLKGNMLTPTLARSALKRREHIRWFEILGMCAKKCVEFYRHRLPFNRHN